MRISTKDLAQTTEEDKTKMSKKASLFISASLPKGVFCHVGFYLFYLGWKDLKPSGAILKPL